LNSRTPEYKTRVLAPGYATITLNIFKFENTFKRKISKYIKKNEIDTTRPLTVNFITKYIYKNKFNNKNKSLFILVSFWLHNTFTR
jgi:hypothetical protein